MAVTITYKGTILPATPGQVGISRYTATGDGSATTATVTLDSSDAGKRIIGAVGGFTSHNITASTTTSFTATWGTALGNTLVTDIWLYVSGNAS